MYYFRHSPLVKLITSGQNIGQAAKINTNLLFLQIVRNKSLNNPIPPYDLSSIQPTPYNWYTLARVLSYINNPLYKQILKSNQATSQKSEYVESIGDKSPKYYSFIKSMIQSSKYDILDLYMLLDQNYKHHITLPTLKFVVNQDNFLTEQIKKRISYIEMVVQSKSAELFQQPSHLSVDDRLILKALDDPKVKTNKLQASPALINTIVGRIVDNIMKPLQISDISASLKALFTQISRMASIYIQYATVPNIRQYVILSFCYKLLESISKILKSCQLDEQFKAEISKKIYKMHLQLQQPREPIQILLNGLQSIVDSIKLPSSIKIAEKDISWSSLQHNLNKKSVEELLIIDRLFDTESNRWGMQMIHKAIREKIDIGQIESLYLHYFQKRIRKIIGSKIKLRMNKTVSPATLVYFSQHHDDLAKALTRCKLYDTDQSS